MSRRVEFELTSPQSKAFKLLNKPRTDVNLEWGRGCGKSWFDRFVAWVWVARADGVDRETLLRQLGEWDRLTPAQQRKARSCRGIRVIFLLPTHKQFVAVHGRLLRDENAGVWSQLGGKLNGTTYQIDFPGGSFIAPFPASEHGSKRALGLRADIVVGDECDDIDPGVFDTIVRPWFSEPWSLKIRQTSGTPRRGRYGLLYQRHLAGKDPKKPRYHTIHATYRDNPEIVDLEEVEDARANTPKSTFAREWECDFDSAEGLVYPFNVNVNVKEPPPDVVWSEMLIAGDHGWEDPGVLLLLGVLGKGRDATVWVLDEVVAQHQGESWWVEQLQKWLTLYPRARCYFDPSMPARVNAYKKAGARVQEVDNSIEDGVSAVADRIVERREADGAKRARLFVHPRCETTIWEFGAYKRKRDPKDTERFLELIVDKHNHTQDSIRYAILGRFGPVTTGKRGFRSLEARQ